MGPSMHRYALKVARFIPSVRERGAAIDHLVSAGGKDVLLEELKENVPKIPSDEASGGFDNLIVAC